MPPPGRYPPPAPAEVVVSLTAGGGVAGRVDGPVRAEVDAQDAVVGAVVEPDGPSPGTVVAEPGGRDRRGAGASGAIDGGGFHCERP